MGLTNARGEHDGSGNEKTPRSSGTSFGEQGEVSGARRGEAITHDSPISTQLPAGRYASNIAIVAIWEHCKIAVPEAAGISTAGL